MESIFFIFAWICCEYDSSVHDDDAGIKEKKNCNLQSPCNYIIYFIIFNMMLMLNEGKDMLTSSTNIEMQICYFFFVFLFLFSFFDINVVRSFSSSSSCWRWLALYSAQWYIFWSFMELNEAHKYTRYWMSGKERKSCIALRKKRASEQREWVKEQRMIGFN